MLEKEFQSKVTRYLKSKQAWDWMASRKYDALALELKVTKGKRLALSKVEEHQVLSLMKARGIIESNLVHKISDSALGFKPVDCLVLRKVPAFLLVGFDEGKVPVLVPVEVLAPRYRAWLASGKKRGFEIVPADGILMVL